MTVGALPDQEMCEHCSSYDGGYPCHMCGALSPADRQNPEALRRAADVIEGLLAELPEPDMPPLPPGPPIDIPQLTSILKRNYDQYDLDKEEDAMWELFRHKWSDK